MHPNVELVLRKFDRELLDRYVRLHAKWYNGDIVNKKFHREQKFLYDNVNILQTLWPLENIPKVLYRGINSSHPEEGEPVFYSNKYKYTSSWSDSKKKVLFDDNWFCPPGAILLIMHTNVMKGKAEFILWPIPIEIAKEFYGIMEIGEENGYLFFYYQREYVLWVNKTIPIAPPGKWEKCPSSSPGYRSSSLGYR